MKHLVILLMLLCLSIGNTIAGDAVINKDNCTITKDGETYPLHGKVYLTDVSGMADITVYLTYTSRTADVTVYLTDARGTTSNCGVVYLVDSSGMADITVYITHVSGVADISVYLTDARGTSGIR
ncbi:MAG: hypothetical protein RRY55_08680 [Bacteroidales bacterium]